MRKSKFEPRKVWNKKDKNGFLTFYSETNQYYMMTVTVNLLSEVKPISDFLLEAFEVNYETELMPREMADKIQSLQDSLTTHREVVTGLQNQNKELLEASKKALPEVQLLRDYAPKKSEAYSNRDTIYECLKQAIKKSEQ